LNDPSHLLNKYQTFDSFVFLSHDSEVIGFRPMNRCRQSVCNNHEFFLQKFNCAWSSAYGCLVYMQILFIYIRIYASLFLMMSSWFPCLVIHDDVGDVFIVVDVVVVAVVVRFVIFHVESNRLDSFSHCSTCYLRLSRRTYWRICNIYDKKCDAQMGL